MPPFVCRTMCYRWPVVALHEDDKQTYSDTPCYRATVCYPWLAVVPATVVCALWLLLSDRWRRVLHRFLVLAAVAVVVLSPVQRQ